MASSIPHRVLRNESSRILREVEAGESFEVTNHGKVVAVISPPGTEPKHVLSIRPRDPSARFDDLVPVEIDVSSEEILSDLRSDR